jgi:hypothetical protein
MEGEDGEKLEGEVRKCSPPLTTPFHARPMPTRHASHLRPLRQHALLAATHPSQRVPLYLPLGTAPRRPPWPRELLLRRTHTLEKQ